MDELSSKARRLGAVLEPFAAQVYFAPECHANYEALGFGPSPGEFAGVQGPEFSAYFCSRGSVMGQVPGEVVAAAFGVFNPEIVVPAVAAGWAKTDAPTICAAETTAPSASSRASWAKSRTGSIGPTSYSGGGGGLPARRPSALRGPGRAPRCPAIRWVMRGATLIACVSIGATRTSARGRRPVSMPPKSAC